LPGEGCAVAHAWVTLGTGCSGDDSAVCMDETEWAPEDLPIVSAPSVASWGPGRLDVFVNVEDIDYPYATGYDICQEGWDNGAPIIETSYPWGVAWGCSLPPTPPGWDPGLYTDFNPAVPPAVATYSPGVVDVFVAGNPGGSTYPYGTGDGTMIYHAEYTGGSPEAALTWAEWSTAAWWSDEPVVSMSAASWLPGRIDLLVVDAGGGLWDCGGDGGDPTLGLYHQDAVRGTPAASSPYCYDLGEEITSSLPYGTVIADAKVVSLGDYRLEYFLQDTLGYTWAFLDSFGWTSAQLLGGPLSGTGSGASSW